MSAAKSAKSTKFTTVSSPCVTSQVLNTKPSGNSLRCVFVNTNGNEIPISTLEDTLVCFAEKPYQARDDVYDEVGGMAMTVINGVPTGPRFFKGTGKGIGFRMPPDYSIVSTITANYKNYADAMGVKEMGVRSTDFVQIKTGNGDVFWLIVLHLSVGSDTASLETLKRYRILKSVMAQAHHLMSKYSVPVFVIGDFNCTRADLGQFKANEEGATNARGNILIPKSSGNTTIGDFKTCFRFDGSDGVDLITNIDLKTDLPYDIDHFFVPTTTTITEFKIDRTIIKQDGLRGTYDHAILELEVIL